eukprot:5891339-Prymnesium_polylepis.1
MRRRHYRPILRPIARRRVVGFVALQRSAARTRGLGLGCTHGAATRPKSSRERRARAVANAWSRRVEVAERTRREGLMVDHGAEEE